MCGLCGIFLNEAHWTDSAVGETGSGARTRRHERLHRVSMANLILRQYGLKLTDWQGSAYLLGGQTGQMEIVPSVAAVWPAAERLRKQSIDPLDEQLIETLEHD